MLDSQTIDAWRNAPRVTSFSSFFEETASGRAGAPDLGEVQPEMKLLGSDVDCMIFSDIHRRLWGHFDSHYFASIPFRLEEECRLGAAMFHYCQQLWAIGHRTVTVYTLGAGTGCLARSLAWLGDGRILTLSCSPTPANRMSFEAKRGSEHAHFFLGPFFELDSERYANDDALEPFRGGFDILFEDTTFQMYGRDRANQLAFIAPRIRTGGLLIQVQKIAHPDRNVYLQREQQKDDLFKSRFFSKVQIASKKKEILETMHDCEVDLETSISALASQFDYSAITWNSGNFYTLVSSNSLVSLTNFIRLLVTPAIHREFCYERLPRFFKGGIEVPIPSGWEWRRHHLLCAGG